MTAHLDLRVSQFFGVCSKKLRGNCDGLSRLPLPVPLSGMPASGMPETGVPETGRSEFKTGQSPLFGEPPPAVWKEGPGEVGARGRHSFPSTF